MNYANSKNDIILNGLNKLLKERKENYAYERRFIKEGKKVIEKGLGYSLLA